MPRGQGNFPTASGQEAGSSDSTKADRLGNGASTVQAAGGTEKEGSVPGKRGNPPNAVGSSLGSMGLSAAVSFAPPQFRMLTVRHLLCALRPRDWFTSMDLTDAYFHITIHPRHRKFLRFSFEGTAYEFQVLPFGLSPAPRIFTKCTEAALAPLRRRGMRVFTYLDDLLLASACFTFASSGILDKSREELLSSELADFVSRFKDRFRTEHSYAVGTEGCGFSQLSGSVSVGQVGSFSLGVEATGLDGSGCSTGSPLYACGPEMGAEHGVACRVAFEQTSDDYAIVRSSAIPWENPALLSEGVPLGRVTSRIVVSTDVSLHGWGALCQGSSVRGVWSAALRERHINYLELRAVCLALEHFAQRLQGRHVLVRTDNMTVVSYINRQGGTRSLPLLQLARKLLTWSSELLASLRAVHVPGCLNGGADMLSRGGPRAREWRLHPQIVAQIWDRFGRTEVDLYASAENTHCPLFFSITDGIARWGWTLCRMHGPRPCCMHFHQWTWYSPPKTGCVRRVCR